MEPFGSLDWETIRSGRSEWMSPESLDRLSEHPLECIETEFPHFVRSIDSPDGIERPREKHPVFYGCYDWHSSVHSHWCLIRLLRLFEDHPAESEIVERLDARFTTEYVEGELAYFDENESFEKPYGWAWFLRLAAELHMWDDDLANEWRDVLTPLEDRIVELVEAEFLSQDRPFRVGTHQNSAFALQGVLDYSCVVSNDELESKALETSRSFFLEDRDYPVEYEPLGWDFLSPALTEADLMRRVLGTVEFAEWIDGFLPDVTVSPYDRLLEPVEDVPEEGVGLHLAGLNLSKAWSMVGIESALGTHRYAEAFDRAAERHAEVGLAEAFTDDYAGAHWLSSFVLYLLTRNDGGIAPS